MVCFDTSFIVDLLRGDQKAKKVLEDIIRKGETPALAAPTLMEVHTNIARNTSRDRDSELMGDIMKSVAILSLDGESAMRAGKLDAEVMAAGEMIPPIDIMIAAIALEHDEVLLTRNAKHFERIPGLKVRGY